MDAPPTTGWRQAIAPKEWMRGPASIEDGYIVLDMDKADDYVARDLPDLVYELAAIRRPPDALAFVERYGLLRLGPEHCGDEDADFREPFADWEAVALGLTATLTMYKLVQSAVAGDTDAYVRLRDRFWPSVQAWLPGEADEPDRETLLSIFSALIAQGVNDGLSGVGEQISAAVQWTVEGERGPPGAFAFTPDWPDLVGLAYHQLLLAIVNRVPMGSCPECGRMFHIKHGRQRYCGEKCASRARYRRHVARHKKKEEA